MIYEHIYIIAVQFVRRRQDSAVIREIEASLCWMTFEDALGRLVNLLWRNEYRYSSFTLHFFDPMSTQRVGSVSVSGLSIQLYQDHHQIVVKVFAEKKKKTV